MILFKQFITICGAFKMNVLFVINNLYTQGNGLSGSARRTMQYLREAGVNVKALSAANPIPDGEQPEFVLKDDRIPVFHGIISKQGYAFAKPDDGVILRALEWADIVHLEEPFALQWRVITLAQKAGVPCVVTYHLHPENLFASVGMMNSRYFNGQTMRVWKNKVFDRCKIVQCPTQNVKERLEKAGVKAELRVISNGLIPGEHYQSNDESTVEKPYAQLLCVGRYSNEKDQMTLLNAMRYSKHADEIRIVFAGRGPIEQKLKRKAAALVSKGILKIEPVFGFYSYDELMQLTHESELYIHCAVIEVEGLSCIEVLKEGVVPVIASGPHTATSQFAKDERSVFPERNEKTLAERIDYWLDHPEERRQMAKRYLSIEEEYDIHRSIEKLIKMYLDALNERAPNIALRQQQRGELI